MKVLKNIKQAKSFQDRLLGFYLKSNSKGLALRTRFGIHTLFLTQAIDVLVLNDKNRVVKIKKGLAPNSFFFWKVKYNTILELPKNTINRLNIKINEKISFK